jgi:hypothetical protein
MRFFNFFKPLGSIETYAYNIWSRKGVIDEFAYPVMRDFFPEELAEVEGWTKSGATSAEVTRIYEEVRSGTQNEDIEMDSADLSLLDLATKRVRCMLGNWKVEPLSLDAAMERLHPDTSAGFGYPGKKKADVLDEIRAQAREIEISAKSYTPMTPLPAILGTRGLLHVEGDPKRRIIYNVPAAQVVTEQRFVGALLDRVKNEPNYPIMFGKNVIPRLSVMNNQEIHPRGAYSVEVDISQFDRNLKTATLRRGFSVMEDMIDFNHWEGKELGKAKRTRFKRVWDYSVYYFLHTPVMTPDGRVSFLDGSVPSGSAYTQFVESIVSLIMFTFFCLRAGFAMIKAAVLGDDCRGVTMGRPDLKVMSKIYADTFHARLNTKKTRIVRADLAGSQFLGYKFRNGFLYRPTMEWFNLMLHPENEVKDLPTSFSRLLAYMFLGGVNSVRFTDFFIKYQTCWPLENWDFVMTKDMKAKMMYGGMNFSLKKVLEYTMQDFVWSLITFKD